MFRNVFDFTFGANGVRTTKVISEPVSENKQGQSVIIPTTIILQIALYRDTVLGHYFYRYKEPLDNRSTFCEKCRNKKKVAIRQK